MVFCRWRALEEGIERIMTALREGIDMKTYMSLYSLVHNFCTSQKGLAQQSPSLSANSGARGGRSIPLSHHRDEKVDDEVRTAFGRQYMLEVDPSRIEHDARSWVAFMHTKFHHWQTARFSGP